MNAVAETRHAECELLAATVRRASREHVQQCGGIGPALEQWPRLWSTARELGLADLGADPALGGVQALCAVMEECGYTSASIPVLPVFLVNRLLRGTAFGAALRDRNVLPCFSFADTHADRLHHSGEVASGRLRMLEFAEHASHLIVLTSATQLIVIDLQATGVKRSPQPGLARPTLCDVLLTKVPVSTFDVDIAVAKEARDIARLSMAARALGAATRAFELAVEHAKTRRQFGQPIGRFQALQHKLADCSTRIDGVRLTLATATAYCDAAQPCWRFFAAAVFAFANAALRQTMLEVQHTFGAIGYSEEHEAPDHFRRVHTDLLQFGGVREARDDLAAWLLQKPGALGTLPAHDLGPEAEALERELQQWLGEHWNDAQREQTLRLSGGDHGWNPAFSAAMAQEGWIGLSWPRAYGGRECSVLEQFAVIHELERVGAPTSYHTAAESLIGPAIAAFGTPEQKQRFLPAILRGELSICLGYSEPEAGSDLAALRTRAVRDGEEWVITGQKLWTTGMEHAQYIWLAARTNPDAQPPHAGISVFMVPLDMPGITRRPSMAFYGQPFTTTFWDEVRVPANALIGELNSGWKVITHALAAERLLMGAHVARIESLFAEVCRHVAREPVLCSRADVRAKIGELAAEVEVARQLVLRTVRMMSAGKLPLHEAAMCKLYSGELMERLSEAALDLVGSTALLSRSADDAPCNGRIEQTLRTSIMMVIGGGTGEIQRNVIAQRGLGLPR